ncbi:MAG: hypothetical protein C4297_10790 [Gemmataceae bacterium]
MWQRAVAKWAMIVGLAGLASPVWAQAPGDPVPLVAPVQPAHLTRYPGYGPGGQSPPQGSAVFPQMLPGQAFPPAVMPPPYPPGYDPDAGGCEYWQSPECQQAPLFYFAQVGWLGLKRQRLGHGAVAVVDPTGVDDGIFPGSGARLAADFHHLDPSLHGAIRAAIGVASDDVALEATGFYLPEQDTGINWVVPGRLTSFFFNIPLGFEGNNFLWDNADAILLQLRTTMANGEINLRWSTGQAGQGLELLIGARYLDVQERLNLRTEDDTIAIGFDPALVATYTSRVHNRLLGGQIGLASRAEILSWLGLAWELKAGWFWNNVDYDVALVRGDGLLGREGGRSSDRFSHIYEAGLFLDAYRGVFRVRAGYQLMWLVGVAEAVDQIDFNLDHFRGAGRFNGSILYHGPTVYLDITF